MRGLTLSILEMNILLVEMLFPVQLEHITQICMTVI